MKNKYTFWPRNCKSGFLFFTVMYTKNTYTSIYLKISATSYLGRKGPVVVRSHC